MKKIMCLLLAGILTLVLCGCGTESATPELRPAEEQVLLPADPAPVEEPAVPDERVLRSAVNILTGAGDYGSGFAVENGYIVTNYHVLYASPEDITVITCEKEEYPAVVLGYDESADIALLEIDAKLEPSVLGDSDSVTVGEMVTAVGNPYGDLSFAMVSGLVLDVNEELLDTIDKNRQFLHFDGDAVSGFSGGPVYNAYGEVIGVLNGRYTGDLSAYGFDCLCRIIPINTVKKSISKILDRGKTQ